MESRSSDRKLKPLPPDLVCHQDSPIAPGGIRLRITFAPRCGAILLCDFEMARVHPEIDKKRQAIVISITALNHKHGAYAGHCTVVPTSSREPKSIGPEDILIPVGKYWSFTVDSWIRCKLLTTVSHARLALLLKNGRPHSTEFLDDADMKRIKAGIRHVMGIA
jgi:uncharacterized protein YifN (PemK superfamily)